MRSVVRFVDNPLGDPAISLDNDLLEFLGRSDGVRLAVNPVEFFEGTALCLNTREMSC